LLAVVGWLPGCFETSLSAARGTAALGSGAARSAV